MKKKLIIIISLFISILFISGITYSKFNVNSNFIVENQKIASFIFEGKKLDNLNIALDSLKPGETKTYDFSIANKKENKNSEVNINYQIIIKTYHFIPTNINLYKIENGKEKFILKCDETFSRNESNSLICSTDVFEISYLNEIEDNYQLKVEFDNNYNAEEYSNLVDYIDLEIKSWQKVN